MIPRGMFWSITNAKYRIIGENVFNNSQNIVVTPKTIASMANIVVGGILMKEKPIAVSHNLKFNVSIMKSSLLIFVIHLTKMTFPLLMLSSLFL